jgi:hypothetical protein
MPCHPQETGLEEWLKQLEHLPSKFETLGSNLSTAKRERERERERERKDSPWSKERWGQA